MDPTTRETEPTHLEWLVVVLMVHLGVWAAATFAGQLRKLSAAQVHPGVASGVVLLALAVVHGVPGAPLAHVGRMATEAVATNTSRFAPATGTETIFPTFHAEHHGNNLAHV